MAVHQRAIQSDCPLCDESSFDFRFEKKGRFFWRCRNCGMEKQDPLPTLQELQSYYDESFSQGMYKTFSNASVMKKMTAKSRIGELEKHIDLKGKWLDVGCANGVFVEELAAYGVEAEGVELSENAVAEARDRGLTVSVGTLEDIGDATYDCITAFDVLEHVLDPLQFLRSLHQRLKPGGKFVITVPNRVSWSARLMGASWYFYIPEEHMFYFAPSDLTKLCEKVGLRVVSAGTTFKPLSFNYSLTQFQEYNPLIFQVLRVLGFFLPKALKEHNFRLPIGEMMLTGERSSIVEQSKNPTRRLSSIGSRH